MAPVLGFIGFNEKQTHLYFDQMAYANREQTEKFYRRDGLLVLTDGTKIYRIGSPESIRARRYDQIIVADDERGLILLQRASELHHLNERMAGSAIPEEFRWQFYNLDYREVNNERTEEAAAR